MLVLDMHSRNVVGMLGMLILNPLSLDVTMLRANEVDVGAIFPTTVLPGKQGCSHSQTIIPFPDPCCFRLHSSHTMGSFKIVSTVIARLLALGIG